MKEAVTYENDKDARELVYTEINDAKLLDFFFKKGGVVNCNNLSYVISENGLKQQIAQNLLNLETKGLIKSVAHPYMRVTFKARWIRLYTNPVWQFWAAVATLLALLLSIIAIYKG